MSDGGNDARTKKKVRSPAYPSISLKQAIDKAQVVYTHERRSAAPVAVIAEHFGSDIKSSSALRLISALKQFGLVIEEGNNEDRSVRLSPLALDILLAENDLSVDRVIAIAKAALMPKIHRLIWEKYNGELPSDSTLKSYLIRELDFNDGLVDKFIRQFRSTVTFAQLKGTDTIDDEDAGDSSGQEDGMDSAVEDRKIQGKPREPSKGASAPLPTKDNWQGPSVRFDLPRGNVVEIRLRSKLTPSEFEKLKKIFDLSELAFVEDGDGESDGGE